MQCNSIKWKIKLRDFAIRPKTQRATLSSSEPRNDDTWQITVDPQNEIFGSRSCRDRELWHTRQAFLTSYQFTVSDGRSRGGRRKVRRWVKETRVVAVEAGTRLGRAIRVKWADFKTTKVAMFRGVAISFVTCFVHLGD